MQEGSLGLIEMMPDARLGPDFGKLVLQVEGGAGAAWPGLKAKNSVTGCGCRKSRGIACFHADGISRRQDVDCAFHVKGSLHGSPSAVALAN